MLTREKKGLGLQDRTHRNVGYAPLSLSLSLFVCLTTADFLVSDDLNGL